jgi:hypothetical protein
MTLKNDVSMKSTKLLLLILEYPNFQPYLIARRLIQKRVCSVRTRPIISWKIFMEKTKTITAIKNEYYTGKVT